MIVNWPGTVRIELGITKVAEKFADHRTAELRKLLEECEPLVQHIINKCNDPMKSYDAGFVVDANSVLELAEDIQALLSRIREEIGNGKP